MANRYRFWMKACAAVAVLTWMANCAPRPGELQEEVYHPIPQHAPDISRPLVAETTVITRAGTRKMPVVPPVKPEKVIRVGLLLPLTGRNAELGRAMQDAATVSLFDKYARLGLKQQSVSLELLPKDTGDTPEQAVQATQAALAEGASFLIGPVFSDATAAAAALAKAHSISMLSFSNNRAKAQSGVYMFGFSPQEQAQRIITYAIQNGHTRIAVLVPDSALGETVREAARSAARDGGITLVAEAKYPSQGVGIDMALAKLLPAGAPSFDALLIPEGGAPLGTIMRALAARGVTSANVQFLGTGMWDDTALIRRVNLEGAWFASSPPENTNQFEARFRATYNYTPPRIASLAYDAVALAVTLATSDRPFNEASLLNEVGFAGPANGIFRLHPNGVVERGLAVMKVEGATFRVLSSPPVGFAH